MTTSTTEIDVRTLPSRQRHATIFSTFRGLATGQAIELINDHDPKPLYYQFAAEVPGLFAWDCVQDGPDLWRVRVVKRAPAREGSECCGCNCSKG